MLSLLLLLLLLLLLYLFAPDIDFRGMSVGQMSQSEEAMPQT